MASVAQDQDQERTPLAVDESGVISVLNRTVQADEQGQFVLPNVPSFMGEVRARATCVRNGLTVSGETDYFSVQNNEIVDVGDFYQAAERNIPIDLQLNFGRRLSFFAAGDSRQIPVIARYQGGLEASLDPSSPGINYTISNPQVATVDSEGLVTAVSRGAKGDYTYVEI